MIWWLADLCWLSFLNWFMLVVGELQCKICMQPFICTTSEAKCREHAEAKHPKSDVYACFPHLKKWNHEWDGGHGVQSSMQIHIFFVQCRAFVCQIIWTRAKRQVPSVAYVYINYNWCTSIPYFSKNTNLYMVNALGCHFGFIINYIQMSAIFKRQKDSLRICLPSTSKTTNFTVHQNL